MKKISLGIELDSDSADALIRSVDQLVDVMESLACSASSINAALQDIADILEGRHDIQAESPR